MASSKNILKTYPKVMLSLVKKMMFQVMIVNFYLPGKKCTQAQVRLLKVKNLINIVEDFETINKDTANIIFIIIR